jgi:uncharacterized membrane protein YjgN (DUF898 family)
MFYVSALMKSKTAIVAVMVLLGIIAIINLIITEAFADKNAQAVCINQQNQGFIGKEQSGDAYKFSKDTCQTLPK